jgi:regulator of sirC expression with transglutaminase-like and TPR domain
MEPTARFTELVQRSDVDIPLDEAMFAIAAHDHDVDVGAQLDRLDVLARDAPTAPDALARHLFDARGYVGNEADYSDPRNSYLDRVLDRRLGIPITLSVLMMEVARRNGVVLHGIGMPGHFLVGEPDTRTFYDPFHHGRQLDAGGARDIFSAIRADVPFREEFLAPVGTRAILARVLANLLRTLVDRSPSEAVWAARLRLRIPGLSTAERREVASLLGSLGRFAEAASVLEELVPDLDEASAARTARDAAALRARAN